MGIDAYIDEIKSRLDIVDVVSQYVPLKQVGRNYRGLCPFHVERTPSFTVSPEKQIFYCFGCGVGGDVIKFLQLIEGVEFSEALEKAAEMAGVDISKVPSGEGTGFDKKKRLKKIHAILAKAFASFLKSSLGEEARKYLKGRGISPLWWETFKLGFAPSGVDLAAMLLNRGFSRDDLVSSGVFTYKNGNFVSKFKNRVIIPITDHNGDVIAFGGRVIGEGEPKYLNSPETPIFRKGKVLFGYHLAREAVRKNGRVILVEGYMDVISMHVAGFSETVASLGTAFTVEQAKRISLITQNVYILYDGDDAGRKAAFRASRAFYAVGVEPKIVQLPQGMDPDDFVKVHGTEELGRLIEEASTPVDLLLEAGKVGSMSKRDVAKRVFELLEDTKDPLVVDSVLSYVSERLSIPFEDLRNSFFGKKRNVVKKAQESADQKGAWERKLIVELLKRQDLWDRYKGRISPEIFSDGDVAFVVGRLLEGVSLQDLASQLDGERLKIVAEVLFEESGDSEELETLLHRLDRKIAYWELERIKRKVLELQSRGASKEEYAPLVSEYMAKLREVKSLGGGAA